MQILWQTIKGGGEGFHYDTSSTAECSRAQMNGGDYLYHWLQEKQQQQKRCLLSQAANAQSDTAIGRLSKCSGCPVRLARPCPWRSWLKDKWTVARNRPRGAPFQVHAGGFPLPLTQNLQRKTNDTTSKPKRIHVRIISVRSGEVKPPPPPAATIPPGSASLSTCSVPTCYHFSPIQD